MPSLESESGCFCQKPTLKTLVILDKVQEETILMNESRLILKFACKADSNEIRTISRRYVLLDFSRTSAVLLELKPIVFYELNK